jgi:hypothetical protein
MAVIRSATAEKKNLKLLFLFVIMILENAAGRDKPHSRQVKVLKLDTGLFYRSIDL